MAIPSRRPTLFRVRAPVKPLSPILVSGPTGSLGTATLDAAEVARRATDRGAGPLDRRAVTSLLGRNEIAVVRLSPGDYFHLHAGVQLADPPGEVVRFGRIGSVAEVDRHQLEPGFELV